MGYGLYWNPTRRFLGWIFWRMLSFKTVQVQDFGLLHARCNCKNVKCAERVFLLFMYSFSGKAVTSHGCQWSLLVWSCLFKYMVNTRDRWRNKISCNVHICRKPCLYREVLQMVISSIIDQLVLPISKFWRTLPNTIHVHLLSKTNSQFLEGWYHCSIVWWRFRCFDCLRSHSRIVTFSELDKKNLLWRWDPDSGWFNVLLFLVSKMPTVVVPLLANGFDKSCFQNSILWSDHPAVLQAFCSQHVNIVADLTLIGLPVLFGTRRHSLSKRALFRQKERLGLCTWLGWLLCQCLCNIYFHFYSANGCRISW